MVQVIPTCILVMKKERTNKGYILFIDFSQHFEKVKTQNVLRKEDINKHIVLAFYLLFILKQNSNQ